jgi:hypothetical protein
VARKLEAATLGDIGTRNLSRYAVSAAVMEERRRAADGRKK